MLVHFFNYNIHYIYIYIHLYLHAAVQSIVALGELLLAALFFGSFQGARWQSWAWLNNAAIILQTYLLGFLNQPNKSKAPVWSKVSADDDLQGKQPNWLEQQAWILAALDAKFAQQEQVIRDLLDTSASAFEGVMPKNRVHPWMHLKN